MKWVIFLVSLFALAYYLRRKAQKHKGYNLMKLDQLSDAKNALIKKQEDLKEICSKVKYMLDRSEKSSLHVTQAKDFLDLSSRHLQTISKNPVDSENLLDLQKNTNVISDLIQNGFKIYFSLCSEDISSAEDQKKNISEKVTGQKNKLLKLLALQIETLAIKAGENNPTSHEAFEFLNFLRDRSDIRTKGVPNSDHGASSVPIDNFEDQDAQIKIAMGIIKKLKNIVESNAKLPENL